VLRYRFVATAKSEKANADEGIRGSAASGGVKAETQDKPPRNLNG
jgi:hypothetical protein